MVRIDDLHLSPTVVKIDAEGYDLRVILGMEETIRRCRPILMVENNPATVNAVSALLADWGYQVLEYDHNRNRLIPHLGQPTRNVFFTLKDVMSYKKDKAC